MLREAVPSFDLYPFHLKAIQGLDTLELHPNFFAAFLHRFSGNGLYIMDEPEAPLSPFRQMAMLSRINELVGQNSQFIISTHSPILMAYPDAILYNLTSNGIERSALEETDHYILMKQFINNRERMLHELFMDEDK